MMNLHELCVAAVNKMVEFGITRHVSYISTEDAITFKLKEGGKIPRVVIDWIDPSEDAEFNEFESRVEK